MPELEGLNFQIKTDTEGASKGLESLSASFAKLKSAASNLRGLSTAANRLSELKDVLSNMHLEQLDKLSNSVNGLKGLASVQISAALPRRIGEIGAAARSLTDEDLARLERLSAALQGLSSDSGTICVPRIVTPRTQENAQPNQPITPDPNTDEANRKLDETTSRAERLRETLSSIGGSIGNGLRSFLGDLRLLASSSDGASRALSNLVKYTALLPVTLGSNLASKVRQTTASLGQMFNAIKRIALYRLIRFIIKEITQGLQEGIKNIYAYSAALNGEFAAAMDNLASSSLYLKNSLGALAAPIIQALVPAINFAIDRIVTLMNMINMLVSALGGRATFTAAKRMETSFADAASGAAGAAKQAVDKIKSYTIGIDEMNILEDTPNSGRGGGGGGGGSGLNAADMFEELPIENTVSDFARRVREAFDSKDWQSLGTLFGEKFNELVSGVKWDKLGEGLGNKVQGVLETVYYTVKTADTWSLGEGIATFLNNAVGQIDTSELGGLLTLKVTKAIDFVGGFLLTMDTATMAQKVGDFFKGVFSEATTWINSKRWDEVGEKFRKQIKKFFENLDWQGMWEELVNFVRSAWGGLGKFLRAVFGISEEFPRKVEDFLNAPFGEFNNVVMTENGPMRKHDIVGWSSGEKTTSYTPLSADELKRYNEKYGTAFKPSNASTNATVTVTAQLKDNSKELRSQLDETWGKVNNTPVAPFATNLKNDGSVWYRDRNEWWDAYNRMPVSAFHTNVTNEGKKWFSDTETYWNGAKKPLPVSVGITTNGGTLWNEVEKAWNASAKTLTARVNIKVPKLEARDKVSPGGIVIPSLTQTGIDTFFAAKGAVLKGAQFIGAVGNTLVGAGEAGREAILPLERNTGWMDTVAERVRDTMKSAETSTKTDSQLLAKMDEILVRLAGIEDDTRRQADKPSNTYVTIGNKPVYDAVVEQGRADGYSFT